MVVSFTKGWLSTRAIHRASAMVLGVFIMLHIGNHLSLLGGVQRHIDFMQTIRPYYRNPIVEVPLLLLFVSQLMTGGRIYLTGDRKRQGFVAGLQALSGLYLGFFLSVHVLAVLVGRTYFGLDTNIYFAASGMYVIAFQWFFLPYYFLAILALFIHGGCAVYWRLEQLKAILFLTIFTLTGLACASLIVSTMLGLFFPVDIPASYLTIYPKW